jgi:CRISPR-associated protein Csb2
MARVQVELGQQKMLPNFFTGHEIGGAPLRTGHHAHLAFAADLPRRRLLVIAPHILEAREPSMGERENLTTLQRAISGMNELRAGSAGLLRLKRSAMDVKEDALFVPAWLWESVTYYEPTRHLKRVSNENAIVADLRSELSRRRIAAPEAIDIVALREGPRGGLGGSFKLRFRLPVAGLILLGRTRHTGGGLFAAAST